MANGSDEATVNNCRVTFQPLGTRVSVEAGTTILEAGRRAGLLLSTSCGGVGVCGKCAVTVTSGKLSPPSADEQAFLKKLNHRSNTRLACDARIFSASIVEVPPEMLSMGQRLQTDSEEHVLRCDPLVQSHQFELEPPTLEDARSDYARIASALPNPDAQRWKMQPVVAAQFAEITAKYGWSMTAFTRDRTIVGFTEKGRGAFGLAVDIGCTKIAAYLLELKTGTRIQSAGAPNPQMPYGEDLISRLVYATRSQEQANVLATTVRDCIGDLASEMCAAAEIPLQCIADACVVGNTAMMHLLLKLPVERLLNAPYIASLDQGMDVPALELGWNFAPGAQVNILPAVGGFVGADHVAMIMAHGIDQTSKVTLGLDIGTNTEIVLRNRQTGVFNCISVPSGPVFEGGHISDGMRAAKGAIDHVYAKEGKPQYTTIDGEPPIGICGSGILDLIAVLRKLGAVDRRGRLTNGSLLLAAANQTGHGRDISLKQSDVTQFQLAKAAISAGIETLMSASRVHPDDVKEVVVAGAFGSYLDLRSAIAIGLLPDLKNAEYRQVGNAAGFGAQMALVSRAERKRAQQIAEEATRLELKHYSSFNRAMAYGTRFPDL